MVRGRGFSQQGYDIGEGWGGDVNEARDPLYSIMLLNISRIAHS